MSKNEEQLTKEEQAQLKKTTDHLGVVIKQTFFITTIVAAACLIDTELTSLPSPQQVTKIEECTRRFYDRRWQRSFPDDTVWIDSLFGIDQDGLSVFQSRLFARLNNFDGCLFDDDDYARIAQTLQRCGKLRDFYVECAQILAK